MRLLTRSIGGSCCVCLFASRKARGHELAFRFAGSAADVPLNSFGERQFDNLVLLAQSLTGAGMEKGGKGKAVTVADVMDFIEDGGESFLGFVYVTVVWRPLTCERCANGQPSLSRGIDRP